MSSRREDQARLGLQIQAARESAGYTQQEVGDLLELSRSTIADIEAGRRRVDTLLLRDMAALFGVQPWQLLTPPDRSSEIEELRKELFKELDMAGVSASNKQKIGRFWQMLDDFSWLRREFDQPYKENPLLAEARQFPSRAPEYLVEAEADRVRKLLGLGDFPLCGELEDLRYLIENRGIPVFMWPLDREPISGLYLRYPELGPILLVNASQVRWRQVFTLAHEFGHVWLHQHEHVVASRIFAPEPKRDKRVIERQANTFAAEFLMPEEGVKRAVATLAIEEGMSSADVVRLQRYFGVSYQAMIVRLKSLRFISPQRYEDLRQESPVRVALRLGYEIDDSEVGKSSEIPFNQRFPVAYMSLVLQAWYRDEIGEGKAAELLHVDRFTLNEFVRRIEQYVRDQQQEEVPTDVGG